MSSDPTKLYPPMVYVDYKGALRINFMYDHKVVNSTQGPGVIDIPEGLPVFPRVVLQAITHGGVLDGPIWTFEKDLDHGRGAWVTYDPSIHEIPSSQALVDAGTESDDPEEVEEEVEREELAPVPSETPSDDHWDLEVGEESADEDEEEDDVTTD